MVSCTKVRANPNTSEAINWNLTDPDQMNDSMGYDGLLSLHARHWGENYGEFQIFFSRTSAWDAAVRQRSRSFIFAKYVSGASSPQDSMIL